MLDSLTYTIRDGKLLVTIEGAANVQKAIYTSIDRPWVNLTAADIRRIRDLVEEMLKVEIGKL